MITIPYQNLNNAWSNYLTIAQFLEGYTAAGNTVAASVLQACRETLRYLDDYISGGLLYQALDYELANLQQGTALPVSVPSGTLEMATNRVNTLQTTVGQLSNLIQPNALPLVNTTQLSNGQPGFADTGLLNYFMTYAVEPPPSQLTPSSVSSVIANQSQQWATYATALLQAFPTGEGDAYESFQRQAALSQVVSQATANFALFADNYALSSLWNSMVVLPLLNALGALLTSGASNNSVQSLNALRYLIDTTIQNLDTLLAVFKEQQITTVRVYTVKSGDSLPNIASTQLGNFEQWQQIAATNQLSPPYTLTQGQQLFLPPAPNVNSNVPPNYLINYLGVDLYYGPLDQDMLPWNGDFFTISGYDNLILSLTRGIITTIGTLIYHPNYGSRVPPEVGNVETAATALNIGAYANSAILYDPRVNKIITWDVAMLPNNQIQYTSTIQPNGENTPSVSLNLVLQP